MTCTTPFPEKTKTPQVIIERFNNLSNDDLEIGLVYIDLEIWKQRFNVVFGMNLPPVEVVVERGNIVIPGTFRCEYGSSGWKRLAALQEQRVLAEWGTVNYCLTIGDLLHSLLHAYEDAYGDPRGNDDHNQSFQDHAAELGLVVDDHGVTHYFENSLFTRLLATYRVSTKALFCPEAAINRDSGMFAI